MIKKEYRVRRCRFRDRGFPVLHVGKTIKRIHVVFFTNLTCNLGTKNRQFLFRYFRFHVKLVTSFWFIRKCIPNFEFRFIHFWLDTPNSIPSRQDHDSLPERFPLLLHAYTDCIPGNLIIPEICYQPITILHLFQWRWWSSFIPNFKPFFPCFQRFPGLRVIIQDNI